LLGTAEFDNRLDRRYLRLTGPLYSVCGCQWTGAISEKGDRAQRSACPAQEETPGNGLRRFRAEHANVEHVLCAAGDRDGDISIDASAPFSGQASSKPYPPKNNIVLPLAKLNTHGFGVSKAVRVRPTGRVHLHQ
jgi:hypothetical protein